jgi:Family of unknown function (DUF6444)
VERVEAEAIYDQGREVVVAVLLRMDEQIGRLEARVARQDERIAQLERRLNRSSRNSSVPPSADGPSSRRGAGRSLLGVSRAASPGMRATGASCCRRARWTMSSSTGQHDVAAGTSLLSRSTSRRVSLLFARSKS